MQIKQECIPVGCVPPAAVAVRGVSTMQSSPLPPARPPHNQAVPRDRAPPGTRPPGPGTPLGPDTPPVDRHTPVNILPCPKLRLRPVIIILRLKTLRAH